MQSPEVKHANCIFDKEIGFNDVDFVKHGVIENGEFFKSFIQKRERKGWFGHTVIVDDGILPLAILSNLRFEYLNF